MAQATRIDDVLFNADGSVSVHYTAGVVPLPETWGGSGRDFPDKVAFIAWLAEQEAGLAGDCLAAIQLAKGYKVDPTLKTTFMSTVKGKTTTLDLTGLASPITVG